MNKENRDIIAHYINTLYIENKELHDIICGLEEILEREIKIGEETFPKDNDAIIVCNTLKQVLNDLNKLKEKKEYKKLADDLYNELKGSV